MITSLHPALVPFIACALSLLLKPTLARLLAIITPIITLFTIFEIGTVAPLEYVIYGLTFKPVVVDGLTVVFFVLFNLVGFLGFLFSYKTSSRLETAAALFYFASVLGVVLAGDLISFFIFWELLTVGAVALVFEKGSSQSLQAGKRYIVYHVLGGLIFLLGLIIHIQSGATTDLTELDYHTTAGLLMFLAIGINCGFPLVHSWLTDAYSQATIGGIIFLSAFTTKAAVYALIRFFPGADALIYIGLVMVIFPIFFAVIENDLRKVLVYSLINQVGFMLVGIGVGGSLGLAGATAHLFTDVLFKSLLFMAIGAVMYRTGESRASELGGLYRYMPVTCVCCIIGAASISAVPLFSGFVSKSLIVGAVANQHLTAVWLGLMFAAATVLLYVGIRVPYFAFFSRAWKGPKVCEAPVSMQLAMIIAALACVAIGIAPHRLYNLLPYSFEYQPYTASHVVFQMQLLLASALTFTVLVLTKLYPAVLKSINLDVDWFYRRGLVYIMSVITYVIDTTSALASKLIMHPAKQICSINLPLLVARSLTAPEARQRLEQTARIGVAPLGITVLMALVLLLVILSAGKF